MLDPRIGEFPLGEIAVVFRKILDNALCQDAQIPGGHQLSLVRPAGGVDKVAAGHAQFQRRLGHLLRKSFFRAAQTLGQDDRGVIAGLHDDALNQIFNRYPFADLDKHLGASLAPGLFADRQGIAQFQPAFLQVAENQINSHNLAHGSRRHGLIRILLHQYATAFQVQQQRLTR